LDTYLEMLMHLLKGEAATGDASREDMCRE